MSVAHSAGAIVLYSPFKTTLWCIRRGIVPPLRVWVDVLASVVIGLLTRSTYSHVLQSVGDGFYIHTRMGLIRHEQHFPAGYMETSIAFMPKAGYPKAVDDEFRKAIGRSNWDTSVLPLTALFRLAYKLGLISKHFRDSYHSVQCASFVALTWRNAGFDLFATQDYACYTGVFPSDYISLAGLEKIKE